MTIQSIKSFPSPQTSSPSQHGAVKNSSCIGKTVQWIRRCEEGTIVAKVGIFFLKTLATIVLFLSVVGIPLYLVLQKQYHVQNVEKKFQPFLDASSSRTQLLHEPNETIATMKEGFSATKKQYLHLKQHLISLQNQKNILQKEAEETLVHHNKLVTHNSELEKDVSSRSELLRSAQTEEKSIKDKLCTLQRQTANNNDEIRELQEQITEVQNDLVREPKKIAGLRKQAANIIPNDKNCQELDEEIESLARRIDKARSLYDRFIKIKRPRKFVFPYWARNSRVPDRVWNWDSKAPARAALPSPKQDNKNGPKKPLSIQIP